MNHHVEKGDGDATTIQDAKIVVDAGIHLSPEEDRRILRKLDLW